jgi:CheY-like chemotaxis protein/two-component sensor histidine kinase
MTTIGINAKDIKQKNHALGKVRDASSHLLGIINDVLDMAKIEADKLELSPIEYNFEKMLQKVAAVVNFKIGEKNQVFSASIDSNIPRFVVGDDQRLSQVITNLLSNAVKFTPENGEIHLEVELVKEVDEVCELRISVQDSGIGITPAQQERLFKAFEQAESGTSREYGGTGLGLTISKRIVELMDGTIRVQSPAKNDKGSKFIFTVKVSRGHKSPRSLLAEGVNWKNIRIMAVDDSAETRAQFSDIFNELSITCDVAESGYKAIELIETEGAYDVYFIDWLMPGMDGVELTRRIKENTNKPSVVTMITSASWEEVKDKATEAGVDKHLLKPLFSSMLIDCVNECLGTPDDEPLLAIDGKFAGKVMLLAEDIETNREILIALLEESALTIEVAENGLQALEKVTEFPDKYDLVLMDVQMPQMDGLEATRKIRTLPQLQKRKLPIIAMTANVFKSDIEMCLEAGMDDHLGKPLDFEKVLEKLDQYLFGNG